MPWYKKIIKSGPLHEEEIYKSIRRRNLKCLSREKNRAESSEKQKALNEIRAKRRCRRMICANFTIGDWYLTLTFLESLSEEEANRAMNNFLRRLNYWCKKNNRPELKYIGCLEKGKQGKRWHGHIIIPFIPAEEVQKIWSKGENTGRIRFESLYSDGNYKKLAAYIRKDVTGKKQLKQSRNLKKPQVEVKEAGPRDVARFLKGKPPVMPRGYRIVEEECERTVNDITGTSFHMTYVRDNFYMPGGW